MLFRRGFLNFCVRCEGVFDFISFLLLLLIASNFIVTQSAHCSITYMCSVELKTTINDGINYPLCYDAIQKAYHAQCYMSSRYCVYMRTFL